MITAYFNSRLIPLEKNPGVRPLGTREVVEEYSANPSAGMHQLKSSIQRATKMRWSWKRSVSRNPCIAINILEDEGTEVIQCI